MNQIINSEFSLLEILDHTLAELRRATVDSKHPFRTCALATVDESYPQIRTVVLRKMVDRNLLFFTDYRSHKVSHLLKNPKASLLFYHPRKKYQVKLLVEIELHWKNAISAQYFKQLNEDQLGDYNSSLAPGEPIENAEVSGQQHTVDPLSHFCVLSASIKQMEVLQLQHDYHLRARFNALHEGWEMMWIQP